MRRARFLADGRVHHGREVDGQLLEDPHRLELRAYVNGALRQRGTTADLAYTVRELIAFLTEFMTLEAGDVLLTGTPRGISPVRPGDVMRLEIDGLGALENPVVAEDDADVIARSDATK